jgi:integrase
VKIVERQKNKGRGKGSLVRYKGVANWTACFYAEGKEHRESTGTTDLKQAKAWLKAKLDDVGAARRGHTTFTPASAQKITVAELLDAWEEDIKLRRPKSAQSAIYHSRAARAKFGTWRAMEVTSEAIDKWVAALKASGFANATCNRRTQMLKSAFKLGKTRKRIIAVPEWPDKLSEEGNARQGFFEQDEVDRVIPELPEHLRDLTRFCYRTAWRKAEALGLLWANVDLAGRTITLPTTKNGKPRSLRLGGEVLDIIRRREAERLTERNGEPVVASHVFHWHGRQIRDFKRAWRSAVKAAGLPPKLFHDLRRSGVRNMIRRGVPDSVAMGVSGHRTRSVFDRYAIVSGADQVAAMEAVSS